MKLEEVADNKKGTYAGVKYSDKTTEQLQDFVKEYDIPNTVPKSKYHGTILYSRKFLPEYKPQGKIDPPWKGSNPRLSVFKSDKDKTNCLVIEYDCKDQVKRHKELMKEHEATYDWPEYKCHITVSYDIGELDPNDMDVKKFVEDIEIVKEYHEDLDLDWAQNNT